MNENIEKIKNNFIEIGIPETLANDLIKYFIAIQTEIHQKNLEKSSGGKFVETIVQIFQALDPFRDNYENNVKNVERELNQIYESRDISNIQADSRIAIIRISRAIYCLRSKRSIIHKNGIDPSLFDLETMYHGAQWIMTEFIRISTKSTTNEARSIIEEIQKPIFPYIENIMGKQLVLSNKLSVRDEILVLLYNNYNISNMTQKELRESIARKSQSSISRALTNLWNDKLIEGKAKSGYLLTKLGLDEAKRIISNF